MVKVTASQSIVYECKPYLVHFLKNPPVRPSEVSEVIHAFTPNLLAASDSTHDLHCLLSNSLSYYFEIFPKNDKWFCPD
jgi:hypothetical protein